MGSQTKNGKAFEYACLTAFKNRYSCIAEVIYEDNEAFRTAKSAFDHLEVAHQDKLSRGSKKSIEIIERLEPNLMYLSPNDRLSLTIQADVMGQEGDVRDVLISKNNGWEIGISAKHNHEAVKHSRLSPNIDFGHKWISIPCSQKYFQDINSVFDNLEILRGIKWDDANIDKVNEVYKPILEAFKRELIRLYQENGSVVPQKLVRYLLGEYDFYKLILDTQKEIIRVNAYNLGGTLNKSNNGVKSEYILLRVKLPTQIYYFGYTENSTGVSDNTMELIFNNGWQLSFRIHNASSKIENSLKFDIKLIGAPVELPTFIGIM